MIMEQGRRSRKALVFVGNYGNRNIGDDAILQALGERYARTHPSHHQFGVARTYPEDVRRLICILATPTLAVDGCLAAGN